MKHLLVRLRHSTAYTLILNSTSQRLLVTAIWANGTPAGSPPPQRRKRQQHAHECDDADCNPGARAHAEAALAVVLRMAEGLGVRD